MNAPEGEKKRVPTNDAHATKCKYRAQKKKITQQ